VNPLNGGTRRGRSGVQEEGAQVPAEAQAVQRLGASAGAL
jgi:hypothetical protein